jgi:formylglycine-generating enzyme required for sulfatase activity
MDKSPLTYLDFELEIGPGRGREYPVTVVRSPAGEARETMRFPFDELALEIRLKDLQIALLRSGGQRRQALSPEEQTVQDFGRSLFDALLMGELRSLYHVSLREAAGQGKGLRLKLRIQPPELATLPWEFLYDTRRAEFVCLSRHTPLVRYLELPQPIQPLTAAPPLRILGMVASPRDLPPLDVAREKGRVERALRNLQGQSRVELGWLEGETWRDLQRAMRGGPWHVFHFVGHGGFDRAADEGFLALADEEGESRPLSATQLGRLLADHRSLRLALLNACEGARSGGRDVFSSTASILVRRGLPAVLAMQYEISDRAAIEFAQAFYEALADGLPVDAAVAEARKAISLAVNNSVEWGTPVLTMRAPDGILFSIGGRGARQTKPKAARSQARQEDASPKPASRSRRELESKWKTAALVTRRPLEPEMVPVPAGEFLMGSDPLADEDAFPDEQPQHRLYLPDYSIARTPVTNARYAAFVQAAGHQPPEHWKGGKPPQGKDEHPVVNISWYDAMAYCAWLSKVTGKSYRLPSEAEWEKGARGEDGRIYPWGNAWNAQRCNSEEGGTDDTMQVGTYPAGASPYGLLDMAGNVWEWCHSLYQSYPYDPRDGREDPGPQGRRVVRGGAWCFIQRLARCACRNLSNSDDFNSSTGFRVVLAPRLPAS